MNKTYPLPSEPAIGLAHTYACMNLAYLHKVVYGGQIRKLRPREMSSSNFFSEQSQAPLCLQMPNPDRCPVTLLKANSIQRAKDLLKT